MHLTYSTSIIFICRPWIHDVSYHCISCIIIYLSSDGSTIAKNPHHLIMVRKWYIKLWLNDDIWYMGHDVLYHNIPSWKHHAPGPSPARPAAASISRRCNVLRIFPAIKLHWVGGSYGLWNGFWQVFRWLLIRVRVPHLSAASGWMNACCANRNSPTTSTSRPRRWETLLLLSDRNVWTNHTSWVWKSRGTPT